MALHYNNVQNNNVQKRKRAITIGPRAQKLLLLLHAGAALALTRRPDALFRIVHSTSKEIARIDARTARRAVAALYQSKLVDYTEHRDGAVTLILTDEGKNKALRYNLNTISIQKPARWDGWWRVVAFDIPERFVRGRKELSAMLKELGFYAMQKSVFIFPYACENEIDFIVETFGLRPYVRVMLVKKTDIDLFLKQKFNI